MTRVRWTPNAADDFAAIIERIREANPAAAQRVARTIYTAVAELRSFPNRGRKGLSPDTRELIFPPWPFIVVYEVTDAQLNVLRVRHAFSGLALAAPRFHHLQLLGFDLGQRPTTNDLRPTTV